MYSLLGWVLIHYHGTCFEKKIIYGCVIFPSRTFPRAPRRYIFSIHTSSISTKLSTCLMYPHVTRKPRDKPAPYKPRKRSEKQKKDASKTSAQPIEKTTRENLTLHDWMTVYKYVDEHPAMSQQAMYRKARPEGVLIFTQATLSRKLKPKSLSDVTCHTTWL
jgi:hypothetical protein